VLAAALTGLFLVGSLASILAMRHPATPAAAPNHFVQVSLLPYFNNKGIGSAPGQANFDGSGFSYPADQLPPAGQTILNEIPYQFPRSALGTSDNIVALGQTITLPQGNYQQASLLVATSWGTIDDKIVVHYMDGSTSSGPLHVDDWSIGSPGVVNASYRYAPAGKSGPVQIYAIQIPMDRTKRASSLTLPMTAYPSLYIPCLHVFALTLQS
jgi:alpha-L-fucosidase